MAVVKVIKIHRTLAGAIRYITNGAKTQGGSLAEAVWNPKETDPEALARQMLDVQCHAARAPRAGGVLGYHVIQSFSPDDPVTPERAHQLGVALMERIAPGHRYVIATHVDRAHIHNHIILCPVGPDGKRMRLPRRYLDQWRAVSDDLCRAEGLSVIEHGIATRHGRSMADIYTEARGVNVKSAMRQAIDLAAQNARDWDTFRQLLARAGIDAAPRGQHLTYTDRASGMKVRDSRLGPAYGMDVIMARLGRRAVSQISFDMSQVKSHDGDAAVVWLPGTRRRQTITVPLRCVIKDGKTWRAFLPSNEPVTICDTKGRYLRTTDINGLYRHFTRPGVPLGERTLLSMRRMPPPAGLTDRQRQAWLRQARTIDRLRADVARLDAAVRLTDDGDIGIGDAISGLEQDIARAEAGLAAQLVARDERIQTGETADDPEDLDEIESRERDIEAMQQDLRSLREFRDRRTRRAQPRPEQPRQTQQTRRREETRQAAQVQQQRTATTTTIKRKGQHR